MVWVLRQRDQWKEVENPKSEPWCINQDKLITNMPWNLRGLALTVYFLLIQRPLLVQMTTRWFNNPSSSILWLCHLNILQGSWEIDQRIFSLIQELTQDTAHRSLVIASYMALQSWRAAGKLCLWSIQEGQDNHILVSASNVYLIQELGIWKRWHYRSVRKNGICKNW